MKTIPVINGDTWKLLCTIVEIELPCVMLPIPKHATPAKTAKATPSHFCFKPFTLRAIKLSVTPDTEASGDVSSFGALATALAATIGKE